MDAKALEEQIRLLEQIVELQKQLLAAKAMAYPVYVPYTTPPLYDPWRPWKPYYYEYQPYTTTTTAKMYMDSVTVDGSGVHQMS